MFSLNILFYLFKVSISNGIAWNGEKKAFYHVDTFERYVPPLLRKCHTNPLARIITVQLLKKTEQLHRKFMTKEQRTCNNYR